MIDFGKTIPLKNKVTIDHRQEWIEGNHEDGYLFGLDNIINIFQSILDTTESTTLWISMKTNKEMECKMPSMINEVILNCSERIRFASFCEYIFNS